MGNKSKEQPIRIEIEDSDDWIYDNAWGYTIKVSDSFRSYGVVARILDGHYLMTGPEWSDILGICDLKDKELADKRMYDKATEKAKELQKEKTEKFSEFARTHKFPFIGIKERVIVFEIVDNTERGKNLEAKSKKD